MAQSGSDSFRSTLAGGSDYVFDFCCDLCERDGKQREAAGYCSDCRDYLCTECFNNHLRLKTSRHHVLLNQHQMPKDEQQNRGSDSYTVYPRKTPDRPTRHVHKKTRKATVWTSLHTTPTISKQEATGLIPYLKAPATWAAVILLLLSLLLAAHYNRDVKMTRVQNNRDARNKRAQHVMDIQVRSRDGSYTDITGLVVLPDDKMVVVDKFSSKIQLINLRQNYILSQLQISGFIRDITKTSSKQVAVTSPDKQTIYFVNVLNFDKLTLDREVKVTGQCHGIARIKDRLFVSYTDPVKVEIISMKGKVLQTVVSEDKGRELFATPWHLAVNKDQQTIYISDWTKGTVTSVSLTGQVLATYMDDKLWGPLGLTVDTAGTVIVLGELSHNILQLTADLTEVQELLQATAGRSGIVRPSSVCYCETTDRLYIGIDADVVKVYQLK